ncbi:MAG TPA: hypothetical protein PLQ36_00245, partial [Candidatus Gracilibacteria bacterium]|nr:hypothetical protein [Candidatus Gracilibacteria bacterium]
MKISKTNLQIGLIGLIISIIAVISYSGGWQANLLNTNETNKSATVYIPQDYTANPGQSDEIGFYTGTGFNKWSSISFSLSYNPEQISFEENYLLGNFAIKPSM